MRASIYLVAYAIILGYTACIRSGMQELNYSLCALGIVSAFYWIYPRMRPVPPLERPLFWPLLLLPCYIVLQFLPLPIFLVKLVSPARAEQIDGLRALMPFSTATLSLIPGATMAHFLRVVAYILVFLTFRDIVLRRQARRWAVAIPLVAVSTLEAVLGLLQYWQGDPGQKMAQGTYLNHSHYANLLAMALPLALMYAVALARREKSSEVSPARATSCGLVLLTAAAAIFLAIVCSLSVSGFVSCLASLCLMGILGTGRTVRPGWKWAAVGAVTLLTVAAFILVPPDPVVERFAGELQLGEGTRPTLWGQALQLVPVYPVFGSGLGGFESALYRHTSILHDKVIDYAHNDYLQLLVELGIAGFLLGAALIVAILRPCVRTALLEPKSERGALAIACLGALAAFLVHSTYNFNFYAPANALMAAAVAGLAVTCIPSGAGSGSRKSA